MPLIVKNTQVKKLYQQSQTVKTQVKKAYVMNKGVKQLVYKSDSGTLTLSQSAPANGIWKETSPIVNSDGYTKLVIESVSVSGGNYGDNGAQLKASGRLLLNASGDYGRFRDTVNSWGGTLDILAGDNISLAVKTWNDPNRDDYGDNVYVTVKFRME